jgi:hypothetical protein
MTVEDMIRLAALAIISFAIVIAGLMLVHYFSIPPMWSLIVMGGILIFFGLLFSKGD